MFEAAKRVYLKGNNSDRKLDFIEMSNANLLLNQSKHWI